MLFWSEQQFYRGLLLLVGILLFIPLIKRQSDPLREKRRRELLFLISVASGVALAIRIAMIVQHLV